MTLPTPYFEKGPGEQGSRGRLLLISYRFPPDTTVGARRWEKLAHFVAERGWGLDVITVQPDSKDQNPNRMEALPIGIRVFAIKQPRLLLERMERRLWKIYRGLQPSRRLRAGDNASLDGVTAAPTAAPVVSLERREMRWPPTRLREWLRIYWAWLEYARFGAWARRAEELGTQLVASGKHAAVITSGPPHMSHEAGRAVAHRTGVAFVMDMRDPWSLTPRLHEHVASPVWFRIAQRYERRAIGAAALVVANNEPARRALALAYPGVADRMIAVLNGSDEYSLPPTAHDQCFRIRFAGTIYIASDVSNLFRAVRSVVSDLSLQPSDLSVDFIGPSGEGGKDPIVEIARQERVNDFVSVGPVLPHAEALAFLAQATMLVIFSGFGPVTLPAKTFEYIRFDAWILAQGEPDSALDLLLRGTGADVVGADDITTTAAAIRRRIEQFRAGVRPTRIAQENDRFSRSRQAAILLDAIDDAARR